MSRSFASKLLPMRDRRALAESVDDLVLARDDWTPEEERAQAEEDDAMRAYYESLLDDETDPHLAMLDAWSDLRGEANRAVLGDDPW